MVGRLGAGCRVAGAGVSADALRCPYVLRHARHAPNSIEPVDTQPVYNQSETRMRGSQAPWS
jgi:hypothetical protein